jgi:hypothetical protein
MSKRGTKNTTRRGFVKKVATGTAAVAIAGRLAVDAAPALQGQKGPGSLESRLESLERRLQQVEDVQAINRLQYAYNYYVEHMMKQEIIDCFADSPDVLLDWLEGKWKGKAGVRKYFDVNQVAPVGFRHQLMPSAGLITVASDGLTAKGRWYAFGGIMMPMQKPGEDKPTYSRSFINGIYEIGYIKEGGVWSTSGYTKQGGIWKMLTIKWIIPYGVRINDGWIMPEDIAGPMLKGSSAPGGPMMVPDMPMDPNDLRYVTGYIFPFHFTHPVTGKPTSEAKLNARLKPLKP